MNFQLFLNSYHTNSSQQNIISYYYCKYLDVKPPLNLSRKKYLYCTTEPRMTPLFSNYFSMTLWFNYNYYTTKYYITTINYIYIHFSSLYSRLIIIILEKNGKIAAGIQKILRKEKSVAQYQRRLRWLGFLFFLEPTNFVKSKASSQCKELFEFLTI